MARNQAENPAIESVILLMVTGLSQADLAEACTEKLGIMPGDVKEILDLARRKLTLAADYNRDEQVGIAITRLNDLYSRAIRVQDNKTALAAQREINKLQGLYCAPGLASDKEPETDAEGMEGPELSAIRGHLIPLGLAAPDYPLREHVRIAADIVRNYLGRKP